MSQRDDDLRMLNALLEEHTESLTDREVEAFAGMRFDLRVFGGESSSRQLTGPQREWVQAVHGRLAVDYANLASGGVATWQSCEIILTY